MPELHTDSAMFRPTPTGRHALALSVFVPEPKEWEAEAVCPQTDPEAFYPGKGGSPREAKAVCARCDVRVQCLTDALERKEPHGVWGGLTAAERRKLGKRRAA